ncbi:MAG: 4Fe-4S dicluster domain-containing protein [Lachnospira sp.]
MSQLLGFSKTVLKNLFSKPATTAYPFKPKEYPERTRGHVENKIEDCITCGLCQKNCPPGAITVDRAAKTWTINRFDCVQCGYCVEKCPKKCLSIVPGYQEPMAEKSVETLQKPYDPEEEARLAAAKEAALKAAKAKAEAKAKEVSADSSGNEQ